MPQERRGSPQGAGPGRSPHAQRASTVRKPSPAQSGRETYEATLTGRKKQAVSIRGRCARLCKKIRGLRKSRYIDGRVHQGRRAIRKARRALIPWRRSHTEIRDEAIYSGVKITQDSEANRTEAVKGGALSPTSPRVVRDPAGWGREPRSWAGRPRLAGIRLFPNGPAAGAGSGAPQRALRRHGRVDSESQTEMQGPEDGNAAPEGCRGGGERWLGPWAHGQTEGPADGAGSGDKRADI